MKKERNEYICLCTNYLRNTEYELLTKAVKYFSKYNKGITIDEPFTNCPKTFTPIPTFIKQNIPTVNTIGIEFSGRIFDNNSDTMLIRQSLQELIEDLDK